MAFDKRSFDEVRALRVFILRELGGVLPVSIFHAMAKLKVFGLLLCEPSERFLSVGITSGALGAIDKNLARKRGFRIIKRYTGGGAVLLGPGQVLYELILPKSAVSFEVAKAMRELSMPVLRFYKALGLEARLEGADLLVGNKKISGQGAGDIEGAFVFVGNVLIKFEPSEFARVIKTSKTLELERALLNNITWLEKEGISISPEEVFRMLLEEFGKALPLGQVSEVPKEVFELARDFEKELEEDWGEEKVPDELKLREGVVFKLNQ